MLRNWVAGYFIEKWDLLGQVFLKDGRSDDGGWKKVGVIESALLP
jgi:hypothetical protein